MMKYTDSTWDFRNADTKEYTHCYHAYPAMMIPQVARRLIKNYGSGAKTLFDPYCGTGTSLVEANLQNINAIGTDLNPLARLIAITKTTEIDLQTLDLYLRDFDEKIFNNQFGIQDSYSIVLPNFNNIDFWFSKTTQTKLAIIQNFIDNIDRPEIKKFFLIAFSETVRESSLTKKGEFKLIRIPKNKMIKFNPDSFKIMLSKLYRNRIGLKHFLLSKHNGATSSIFDFNTVNNIPKEILPKGSVDIVITSPPYGDSRTTVAYGQYSRLANQWMGIKEASKVDKILMGGVKYETNFSHNSNDLKIILQEIEKQDLKRANEVKSFFIDYKNSITNVSKTIKKNGYSCYVVGNRTVKGINIPMDLITRDFFESNGFTHIETVIRNIPNKRMPSKNSPTNIKGVKSSTMKNEYIVVLKKN